MPLHRRLTIWLAYLAAGAAGVLATIVLVFAVQARLRLPDLRAWHQVTLEQEYRVGGAQAPASFAEYLAREEQLFRELHRRGLGDAAAADTDPLRRYNSKSVGARLALDTKYNPPYELAPPDEVRGAGLFGPRPS